MGTKLRKWLPELYQFPVVNINTSEIYVSFSVNTFLRTWNLLIYYKSDQMISSWLSLQKPYTFFEIFFQTLHTLGRRGCYWTSSSPLYRSPDRCKPHTVPDFRGLALRCPLSTEGSQLDPPSRAGCPRILSLLQDMHPHLLGNCGVRRQHAGKALELIISWYLEG